MKKQVTENLDHGDALSKLDAMDHQYDKLDETEAERRAKKMIEAQKNKELQQDAEEALKDAKV